MVIALRLPTVPRDQPLAAKFLHFLFLLLLALGTARSADAGTLALAWDASPDPSVRGYRVYVGTSSGVYTETFDVVGATSFVYPRAVDGRSYYFAVAAFGANRLAGLPSAEISALATPVVTTVSSLASDATARSDSRALSAQATCARDSAPCYSVRVLAEGRGAISGLAPTPDGRVFFIEDGQRIQLAGNAAGVSTALAVDPAATVLTGLALDPAFEANGRLLVGEIDRRASATADEMSIARYRVLNSVLGERMHVTSVLAGRQTGVPFTTDADGHVYVAVPSTSGDARLVAPAGAVLRFAPDGRVPDESWRGSPLLAASLASPTALSWDRVGQKLWVSGTDGASTPTVATMDSAANGVSTSPVTAKRLPLQPGNAGVSGVLVAARGDVATQSTMVWLLGSNQSLYAGTVARDQAVPQLRSVPFEGTGEIVAIAVGQRGEGYVAVRSADGGAPSFSIVVLIPRD